MFTFAEDSSNATADRVRRSTEPHLHKRIDSVTEGNIQSYAGSDDASISKRIQELDTEWDVERALEVNASTLALTGLALGLMVNKKWLPHAW